MLSTNDLGLYFGSRKLFEGVNIRFTPGHCYGVIGANGAGKSTFLKLLSEELEPSSGSVDKPAGSRISVLKQNHFEYQDEIVVQTVILGNKQLISIMKEKDAIYAKADFSEEDGVRAAELETQFADMNGWEAESDAAYLLEGIGISTDLHQKKLAELKDDEVVKVLLAQALFGRPDILLLDEPTNHLDNKAINWLENFILNFDNIVIVVSHDRHFLNEVCSHTVDIDFGKAQLFVGNYDFWYQSSQLAIKLKQNENKKREDKAKDLEAFIQRFSANASKSKQATARRKQLENLTLEDIPTSSRKRPYVRFDQEREAGDRLLEVNGVTKMKGSEPVLNSVSFEINKGEKVLILSDNELSKTALLDIIMGEQKADSGDFKWGVTTSQTYLPKENEKYFSKNINLIDWLRQYSEDQSENFIRSFLGRMLFTGEETKKIANVLSGGEKVRCMLSKMMLSQSNVLVLDGPTNHLDLESISALNDGLIDYKGTIIFTTHDHQFAQTLATRLIEITANGIIDHQMSYNEYMEKYAN